MVDLLLGLGAEPGAYNLSRTLNNPIWQLTESKKDALEGCFRKHGKLAMTSVIVQDLMGISSESDLLDRQDEMAQRWLATGADVSDVTTILEFMEQHPAWEFGKPGAFVRFAEKFYRKGYEKRLIDSINRRPVFHTLWMLNRVVNGEKDAVRKATYVALFSEVVCREGVEESVQSLAREFFALHTSPQ